MFTVLNELEREGVIKRYALGGAMALLFYAEPRETLDADVFVFLPETKNGFEVLTPLWHALRSRGYAWEGEGLIRIEGIPVQFLPPPSDLVEEAIKEARVITYQGVQAKVFHLEHLFAIMLELNRPKDRERILGLLEEHVKIDDQRLHTILIRHGLQKKWEKVIEKTD
ncbi:MAG: hypothetical protein HY543_11910 [Deltaproteobacteria bacterium]|nr:hypothetical protein [Deltaproteobacteria bacterium]